MTNSLAEDIVSRGQELADNLNTMGASDADVEDGLKTLVGKVLDISTSKIRTVLTLNTPMLVYTDEFDVTGTLTDEEDNPIEDATITLVWNDGTEHIASETTDENGEVTFHSTDPASVSSYSFQLVFAGDSVYSGSSSSTVTVSPNKETAVLVVNCPSTTISSSVTVSGTLKDNDNTPMSGTTIFVKINGSTSSTNNITVSSDGTFSKTISGLSEGSNSVIFSTTGSSTHTAVSQTCTVTKTSFDGIDLESDKSILSAADNEYATLTAQLTSGGSPISIEGETVTFEVRKQSDNSLVETLTADTNSSGVATVSYLGKGVGDLNIKAKCNLLIQTFAICDAWRYSPTEYTSTQNIDWSLPSGNFEIDFKCRPSYRSSCFPQIGIGTDTNNIIYMGQGQSSGETTFVYKCNGTNQEVLTGTHQSTLNDWNNYEYSIVNGVHTLKGMGDTLTSTKSCVTLSKVVQIYNQNSKIKDILIKPL